MKAVVYHKPGDMRVETIADPKIEQPTDIILKSNVNGHLWFRSSYL